MKRKALSSILGTLIVLSITLALGGLLYMYSQGLFNNLTKSSIIPISVSIYPDGNNAGLISLSIQNTGDQVLYINEIKVLYNGNVIADNTSIYATIPAGETYSQYYVVSVSQPIIPGQTYTVVIQGFEGTQTFSQVLNVVASG